MYPYGHPDELCLEDFARAGDSTLPQFARIREHVQGCVLCQDRQAEMSEFVQFMRASPEETSGELVVKRDTAQGTVFLIVRGADATEWEGRAIGAGHEVTHTFRRGPEALDWLEHWFDEAVLGHHAAA